MQAQYKKEQDTLVAHRHAMEAKDKFHEKSRDEWFAEKKMMQTTHAQAKD
jgi:hypothetical protein